MQITPRTYVHRNRTTNQRRDERKTAEGTREYRKWQWGDRKHKVAWKSLSFVEPYVKGGGEADVRPHTDNSTECSVEFMRFNPLRNPREAASPVFPILLGIRRLKGMGGPGPTWRRGPHAGDAKFKVHEEERARFRVPCLTAKERVLTPGNKTHGVA